MSTTRKIYVHDDTAAYRLSYCDYYRGHHRISRAHVQLASHKSNNKISARFQDESSRSVSLYYGKLNILIYKSTHIRTRKF